MNKKTLVWTLIVAVPVGIAALATAYIYRDTGKLPFQETGETVTAPETATDGTQTAAAEETPAASQDETTEANAGTGDANTAPAKGPSFDVVGVEPTGETVVAGRSDAGAIVALTANGKVVGKSIANEAGEWTIILDEPLKPGDYDVGLEVHDEAGAPVSKSEEHVVVSLPEGGKEQPLVVLNTPEGPSNILQKPAAEQEVAAAEPAPQAQESAAASAAETETAAVASEESVTGSAGAQQTAAEETGPAAGTEETQVAAASAETPEETVQAETAPAPESATTLAEAPVSAEAGTETQSADSTQADVSTSGGATTGTEETEVASAEPATETRSVAEGAAPEDQAGTSGTTAVETAAANDSQPTAGETETSATTVADAPAEAPETQATATDATPAVTAEAVPAQAAPTQPTVTVEAVESEKDKVYVAGTGEPGSSVRVYVGDDFQGEAQVNSSGKWLIQGSKNIAEGNVEVRADLIAEDGNSVDARAAVTFEKEQDKQIVLTKVVASGASGDTDGQGAAVKKALPVVIIRKGDNLWRISRRLYGQGVRYTTIYQANQDQIRNPDLIYPGQVFLTPEGDLNWKQTDENNG